VTPGHERYAEWDGAYLLGALSAAEREEFERHLAVCAECTAAIAGLTSVPGLLSRVDDHDAAALLADAPGPEVPAGFERRLLAAARQESRPWWRRTSVRIGVAVAAAVAVVAAVVVPLALDRDDPATTVTLAQAVPSPLTAEVSLRTTDWGTRIDMVCSYAAGEGGTWAYGLYVVDADGRAHEVATWHAGPGTEVRTSGSTDLDIDQLRGVQVRAADGKTVLLAADL